MTSSFNLLWEYALPKERNVGSRATAVWRDRVFCVFHYDKKSFFESAVIALSLEDGRELWRQTIDHVANEPLVGDDGNVYVASFGGVIHAYSPDGEALWQSILGKANLNAPVRQGNLLFVAEIGGSGSRTWCLDTADGKIVWSYENGGHSYRLLAEGGRLYHATVISGPAFGQSSVHLTCLDQQTGGKLWSIIAEQYHFNALVSGGLLLWGARNGLNAYDPETGVLKAGLTIPQDTAITVGPINTGGLIVSADDSGIIRATRLERKGLLFKKAVLREVWSTPQPASFIGQPVIFGEYIHLLTDEGQLYRFDMEGQQIDPILNANKGNGKGGGLTVAGDSLVITHGRTLGLYRP